MSIWDTFKDPIEKRLFQRKIYTKVFKNIENYDEHLSKRRKRLSELLFDEEHNLKIELKQQEQAKVEYMIQKQKDEVQALEELKNKQQEEILSKKHIQLDMVRCKEIQPLIRKRRDLEIFETQLKQIKEQQENIEKAKEIEKMWHLKMMSDAEKNIDLERKKITEKIRKEAEMKEFLAAQMLISQEAKKREKLKDAEESTKVVLECEKKSTIRNENDIQKKVDNKIKLAEDLKCQINENQMRRKKEREAEIEIETSITKKCLIQDQEVNQRRAAALEKRKHELELYGQYALAVRQERETRERAADTVVAEEAQKQIEENDRRKQLEIKKSVDLLNEALVVRHSQLLEKKKESEKEAQIASEEMKQRMFKEKFAKEEVLRQKREMAMAKTEYRKYLEEQMKHRRILEEKCKNNVLLELKQQQNKEEEFNNKMIDLMKREFETESTHPFTQSINNVVSQNKIIRKVPETPYCKY